MRKFLIALNLAAPLAAAALWAGGHFWPGLAALFVAHLLALIATLVPSSTWWGPVVCEFDPDGQPEVWLTIDDGPDPEDTPRILDLLEHHHAHATFFVIGEKAQRWPDLVQAMAQRGHAVENHTLHHDKFSFWRFGPARLRAEIEGGQRAVADATGREPRWFRAPAGMRNGFVHPILRRLGLGLLGWSVRGRDGVSTDRDAIVSRLIAGMRPGAILLMHEGMRDPQGRSVIADTLPRVLEALASRGLRTSLPTQPATPTT